MLNTVSKAVGLQLEYVREEFLSFLPLNTVQYVLKDSEQNFYLLIMSFDCTQDFFFEREKIMVFTQECKTGLLWNGTVMGKCCSLYSYSSEKNDKIVDTVFLQQSEKQIVIDEKSIEVIQEDFLSSFPEIYRKKILELKEYAEYLNVLSRMERLEVGTEEGFIGKEQIAFEDGKAVTLFCGFGKRLFQPIGYDEEMWLRLSGNRKQYVHYKKLNCLKYKLIHRIYGLIRQDRTPKVSVHDAVDITKQKGSFALNNYVKTFSDSKNYCIHINADYGDEILPVSISGSVANIGTWMNPIGREMLIAAIEFIFKQFKGIKRVAYQNVLYDTLLDHGWKHNDFYLPLPETIDELKQRLSSKGRYNLRRERRIIQETFEGLELRNIPFQEVPTELIERFYELKNETHGVSSNEYDITKRNITDVYVLRIGNGDVKGIAISCEQGDIVFLENHTFDSTMRSYSFGQVLYDMFLDEMVKKGKQGVALGGGNLEYKHRYGTTCAIARSGSIYKNAVIWMRIARSFNVKLNSKFFRIVAHEVNQIDAKTEEKK